MIKLRIGQTITDEILGQCGDLPDAAKAELWKGRTLNKKAVAVINAATAAKKKKAAPNADVTEGDKA